MTGFCSLSAVVRAFFALWALLLSLTNIFNVLLAAVKKQYLFSALALLFFTPVYFLWQVIFDLSLFGAEGAASASRAIGEIPWAWWLAAFFLLTGLAGLLLAYNVRYKKNYLTPGAIKLHLDEMPCGVCCWKDNGRVLFSNICMNELCLALTGGPLLNGNHFSAAVGDGILTVGEKRWRFTCREIVLSGEKLHEMIASDVTTEYAKTQALEEDKAELSRINRELREYNLGIDDTVRRQEILQAKVNIHDEMNRLMLSTVVAERGDGETLDKIFSLWEKNALLLCKEAEEISDNKALVRLKELAAALKIDLVWTEDVQETLFPEQRSLFFSAAQEAIANASKHARAKEMHISFTDTERGTECRFVNDGEGASGDVVFSGGLANLSRLASDLGATVTASGKGAFTLTLTFLKK